MTATYKVGKKGQVVISKSIRVRLGVTPGWTTVQRLVDDHVELRFIPPEHDRSLQGSLSSYVESSLSADELRQAREGAWREAAVENWRKESASR